MISVCIIDDDKIDRFITERALRSVSQEWTIFHADNEESGYTIVERERPDIVILDVNLMGSCGIELGKRMTREISEAAFTVVNITGIVRMKPDGDEIDPRAAEMIPKPMRLSEYPVFVDKILEQHARPPCCEAV